MKIKTKKQLNLPQLIEYIVKNDLRNKMFTSDSKSVEPGVIYVSGIGAISTQLSVYGNELFTVEVEEEITEDTVIPNIVSIGRKNENEINIHHYCRISQFIDNKNFNYYVLNDDDTLTLIWRDGKLIKE